MLGWLKRGLQRSEEPARGENFATKVNRILDNCPFDANLIEASNKLIFSAIFADEAIIEGNRMKLQKQVNAFEQALNNFKQQVTYENVGTTTRDLELLFQEMSNPLL